MKHINKHKHKHAWRKTASYVCEDQFHHGTYQQRTDRCKIVVQLSNPTKNDSCGTSTNGLILHRNDGLSFPISHSTKNESCKPSKKYTCTYSKRIVLKIIVCSFIGYAVHGWLKLKMIWQLTRTIERTITLRQISMLTETSPIKKRTLIEKWVQLLEEEIIAVVARGDVTVTV